MLNFASAVAAAEKPGKQRLPTARTSACAERGAGKWTSGVSRM